MKNLRKFQLGIKYAMVHIPRINVAFIIAPSKCTVVDVKFFEFWQRIKLVSKRVFAGFEKIFQINNFNSAIVKRNFNQIIVQIFGMRYGVRIGWWGRLSHFILLVIVTGLNLILFSKNCVQASSIAFLFADTNTFKSLSFAGGNLPLRTSYITLTTTPFLVYNFTIISAPLYSACT